ncbi:Phosphatidylinositol N-acetyglucosaminlytransferase subunit P-like protein [Hirschfeldia incana]|nr:Phosphatidylinositol N-acetyglucosaminlytransferase subunit P-like protein [Hirschfeldia incana]
MEKEICRRHISRDGTGCVWLFMNMFDLRHGGSNHKLLMDKKRGSKRISGIESKVEKQLTCECGCEKSVKKLIEEEIDEKTKQKCDATECRGKTKARNEKRRSRTCSKTSEDMNVLSAGDDDHAKDQCPRTSQSDADSIDNDDSEEKFSELIKRLIAQKESEVESCKNLVDDDSKEESSFLNIGTSPKKETSSPDESRTQTIVVLKPEPNCFDLGSSPRRQGTRNKAKNERSGSRFTLSRIRRRLKSPKNPCHAQHESDQDPDDMGQNSCLEEEIETSSGRHVSDGEILPEANSEGSKKTTCGIYIAAKKHLSDMLAEGGIDVDAHDKEVPRILGKILALPQFSTPENSPRMTLAQDVVAPQITEKPNIQQCSSEDYSETLGSDSNDHEETKSDLSVPGEISFSIVHQDAYLDEDKFEAHDEHKHTQEPLEKETYEEKRSPCSPPSSSVKMSECQDNATDVPGKSSPVSVLEPFFTDDDTSPSTSRFSSVEMRLKPLCIRFEEPDSPRPEKDNSAKTRMDDKELTLAYIQDVVTSSELNREELLARSFYSDQVLEQALMDDIDFCSTAFCDDKKLLFDCINEVLMEFCRYGPWISFTKPAVNMENAVEVVQEEVYWHLLPLPSPHTLDQIVRKDLARNGCWMDLRFDIGSIGSQTGEIILEELLDEIITTCTDLFQ